MLLFDYAGAGASELPEKHYSGTLNELNALINLLNAIDVRNSESLYSAQQRLMVPVTGAYGLGCKEWQDAVLLKLIEVLHKTVTLGEIREGQVSGKIVAEERLADPSKSGKNGRRIFPCTSVFPVKPSDKFGKDPPGHEDAGKSIIRENILVQTQFSYLISYVLKEVCSSASAQARPLTALEKSYMKLAFPFLLDSIVKSHWLDVEAWHWVHPYPNMKERVLARLDWKNRAELQRKSYYKAFHDTDLFIFAIASDLLCIGNMSEKASFEIGLNKEDENLLTQIRDLCFQVVQDRIAPGDGFDFQVGAWADHPEYFYAGCDGDKMPEGECRKADVSDDTSHFHRWPWWLQSYRDAWPIESGPHGFYENLISRLANQFVTKVAVAKDGIVLLNNYMDGTNGWYRVKYQNRDWGYGPYGLSRTALMGSWYSLAPYDSRIGKLNRMFCEMLSSNDKSVVASRIKFYGNYNGNNAFRNAWGTEDVSTEMKEYYGLVCQVAEELGWMRECQTMPTPVNLETTD